MNYKVLEVKVNNLALEKRNTPIPFEELVDHFEKKLGILKPEMNSFFVRSFFGTGIGAKGSLKRLLQEKKIKEKWIINHPTKKGFKGVYIFVREDKPFYVGISRGVIGRIQQHVKGKSHFTASLAYKIARELYDKNAIKGPIPKNVTRDNFDFMNEVPPIQEYLMNQRIAMLAIDNDDELALFEIFCSMKLGTRLNTFKNSLIENFDFTLIYISSSNVQRYRPHAKRHSSSSN